MPSLTEDQIRAGHILIRELLLREKRASGRVEEVRIGNFDLQLHDFGSKWALRFRGEDVATSYAALNVALDALGNDGNDKDPPVPAAGDGTVVATAASPQVLQLTCHLSKRGSKRAAEASASARFEDSLLADLDSQIAEMPDPNQQAKDWWNSEIVHRIEEDKTRTPMQHAQDLDRGFAQKVAHYKSTSMADDFVAAREALRAAIEQAQHLLSRRNESHAD